MAKEEVFYVHPLRRPFSERDRLEIDQMIEQNKHLAPVKVQHEWERDETALKVHTPFVSWRVTFSKEEIVVTQKVSLAGRLFNTKENRKRLRAILDETVEEMGL
jgi:hypothetical protein